MRKVCEVEQQSIQDIISGIHNTKDYERRLFGAVKSRFNENLGRWVSELRLDHFSSNCFIPDEYLTTDDVQAAVDANMARGLDYAMFSMSRPMDVPCLERYDFDTDITYVMAILEDRSHTWQINDSIEIRDIQTSDISEDILDVSDVPEEFKAAAYRNMQIVLEVAKSHPNYHWLCAYKNGKKVGTAYALEYNGFIEMDDLWVDEAFRYQRIATTIVKYIAEHMDGIIYLHAASNETPKEMYAKMGFKTVETIYEYYLEW